MTISDKIANEMLILTRVWCSQEPGETYDHTADQSPRGPGDSSTAEGQSSQAKNGGKENNSTAKDQPSQTMHGDEQEDALDFVIVADGISESNEASNEGADFQLQLEWMSV